MKLKTDFNTDSVFTLQSSFDFIACNTGGPKKEGARAAPFPGRTDRASPADNLGG